MKRILFWDVMASSLVVAYLLFEETTLRLKDTFFIYMLKVE
jgi:hypothetical protein